MSMSKKVVRSLLAIMLVVGLMPTTAFATEEPAPNSDSGAEVQTGGIEEQAGVQALPPSDEASGEALAASASNNASAESDESNVATLNMAPLDGPDAITVVDGTATDTDANKVPYDNYHKNGLAEVIYTADQITAAGGSAGVVQSIAFNHSSADSLETTSFQVYLKATDKESFDGGLILDDLTKVYDSSNYIIGGTEGWKKIDVSDAGFFYDGTSNLLICIAHKASGYKTALKCKYESTSASTAIYRGDDGNASMAEITNTTSKGTPLTRQPSLQLVIAPSDDPAPSVSPASIEGAQMIGNTLSFNVDASKTLTGSAVDASKVSITGYQWSYRIDGGEAVAIDGATNATCSFTIPETVEPGSTVSVECTVSYTIEGEAKTTTSNAVSFSVRSTTPVQTPIASVSASASSVQQGGTPVTLTAQSGLEKGAAGVGTITYQWQKATEANGTYKDIENATASTYEAAAENVITTVYYRCVVTNTFENVQVATSASEPVAIVTKSLEISSVNDLASFRDSVNAGKSFAGCLVSLKCDLDLSSITDWTPIGASASIKDTPFQGLFDGEGHTISGLSVDASSSAREAGLFGYITTPDNGAAVGVKNLVVKGNVTSTGANSSSGICLGGIVGQISQYDSNSTVVLDKLGFEGAVSASNLQTYNKGTGGIVGKLYANGTGASAASISNSFARGSVAATGDSGRYSYVGGLAGYIEKASVVNCYAGAEVSNQSTHKDAYTAGLVGRLCKSDTATGTVTNCYATGSLSDANQNAVGIVNFEYGSSCKSYAASYDAAKPNYYRCEGTTAGDNMATGRESYSSDTAEASHSFEKSDAEMRSIALLRLLNQANGETPTYAKTSAAAFPQLVWEVSDLDAPLAEATAVYPNEGSLAASADETVTASVLLEASATGGDTTAQAVSWQWYKLDSSEEGASPVAIEGATEPTCEYTVSSDDIVEHAYQLFCEVGYSQNGTEAVTQSNPCTIQVVSAIPAATPENVTVSAPEESDQEVSEGQTITLSVSASVPDEGTGNLSYQWYSVKSATADQSTWTPIPRATGTSYEATASEAGQTNFYACVVTNTFEQVKVASAASNILAVATVPLRIGSADELVAFANRVNAGEDFAGKTVELTRDIDMEGVEYTPAGSCDNPYSFKVSGKKTFDGTFNGNGFSIKNLALGSGTNRGVFGAVYNAVIENLVVTGSYSNAGQYSGGAVGVALGSTVVRNIGCNVAITTSSRSVGGVVGYVATINDTVTVDSCYNKGVIESTDANSRNSSGVGGIVGEVSRTSSGSTGICKIANCYNAGNVTTEGSAAGGIVGNADSSYLKSLTGCYNTGTIVKSASTSASYANSSGAIIGSTVTSRFYASSVKDCLWVAGTNERAIGYYSSYTSTALSEVEPAASAADINAAALGNADGTVWVDQEGASPILYWETIVNISSYYSPDLSLVYSGEALAPSIVVKESSDAPAPLSTENYTVAYYTDRACTQAIESITAPGIYFAKATGVAEKGYTGSLKVTITVEEAKAEAVAQVVAADGSSVATYAALAEAVAAAEAGQTVKLLADAEQSTALSIDKSITLDLNQKTLSAKANITIAVYANAAIANGAVEMSDGDSVFAYGKLLLTDVDITGPATSASLLYVNYTGDATVDKDSSITATDGTSSAPYPAVFISGQDNNNVTYDPVLNIYGTVRATKAPAIQGNGTDRGTSHINIYDGALVSSSKLAIYLPQPCEVNITGGLVEGYCGIGIKSGTLNISGGTVRGVANDNVIGDQYSQTNGISYDGSAIMIDSYIGYAGQVRINISDDAVVESRYSTAIREIGNDKSQTNLVGLEITGGKVLGAEGTDAVLVRDVTAKDVNISGGEFSRVVKKEYCAPGFTPVSEANGNGLYGVTEGKFTVKVTSRTTTSDSPVANVSGGGSDVTYAEGTTVAASAISGYKFVGWFVNEYAGAAYSTDLTCEVKPTDDCTMIAVYEPVSGGAFALEVSASKFTVNGGATQRSYLLEKMAIGTQVTVVFTGSENFQYWVNESGKVVSTSKEYTFYMGSATTLKAVYAEKEENQAMVVFVSHTQQVVSSKGYTNTQNIQFPEPPIKMGATFVRWSMTQDEIRAAMATTETGIIVVEPLYEFNEDTYKVTIGYPDGDVTTEPETVGRITELTAKKIDGMTFKCWKSGDAVLGYTETLKVAPRGDLALTAEYVADGIAVERLPVITLTEISTSQQGQKYAVSFTATRSVPEGYTVVEQGVLVSTDSRYGEADALDAMKLDADGAKPVGTLIMKDSNTDATGVTVVNGTTKYADRTVYGRAYMILRDSNGATVYVYSDAILSGSYNGLANGR